jgi:hypothetical protein
MPRRPLAWISISAIRTAGGNKWRNARLAVRDEEAEGKR